MTILSRVKGIEKKNKTSDASRNGSRSDGVCHRPS